MFNYLVNKTVAGILWG